MTPTKKEYKSMIYQSMHMKVKSIKGLVVWTKVSILYQDKMNNWRIKSMWLHQSYKRVTWVWRIRIMNWIK